MHIFSKCLYSINMECDDEDRVLFATAIAMELARGKSMEEIDELRNLINQISCSLTTLLHQKPFHKPRKF